MSAMLEVSSSLMRTVLRVHHREESRHEASSEGEKPDTQEERERSCSMQHGAVAVCLFDRQRYCHRCSFVAASFGIRAISRWSLAASAPPLA